MVAGLQWQMKSLVVAYGYSRMVGEDGGGEGT